MSTSVKSSGTQLLWGSAHSSCNTMGLFTPFLPPKLQQNLYNQVWEGNLADFVPYSKRKEQSWMWLWLLAAHCRDTKGLCFFGQCMSLGSLAD